MMTNTWIAICDDVVGFYGIPTNTIKSFFEKRKELLRSVILSEIRQGDFSRVNEDDMIAICYRLLHDAMEGVAKNNLCLMARLICGLNKNGQLTANNFQKYAKILADLDENEIVFLATSIKYINQYNNEFKMYDKALDNALIEIFGEKKEEKFADKKYEALLVGLQRTGLIVKNSMGWSGYSYKNEFSFTQKFKELVDLFPNWEDIATYSCVGNKER